MLCLEAVTSPPRFMTAALRPAALAEAMRGRGLLRSSDEVEAAVLRETISETASCTLQRIRLKCRGMASSPHRGSGVDLPRLFLPSDGVVKFRRFRRFRRNDDDAPEGRDHAPLKERLFYSSIAHSVPLRTPHLLAAYDEPPATPMPEDGAEDGNTCPSSGSSGLRAILMIEDLSAAWETSPLGGAERPNELSGWRAEQTLVAAARLHASFWRTGSAECDVTSSSSSPMPSHQGECGGRGMSRDTSRGMAGGPSVGGVGGAARDAEVISDAGAGVDDNDGFLADVGVREHDESEATEAAAEVLLRVRNLPASEGKVPPLVLGVFRNWIAAENLSATETDLFVRLRSLSPAPFTTPTCLSGLSGDPSETRERPESESDSDSSYSPAGPSPSAPSPLESLWEHYARAYADAPWFRGRRGALAHAAFDSVGSVWSRFRRFDGRFPKSDAGGSADRASWGRAAWDHRQPSIESLVHGELLPEHLFFARSADEPEALCIVSWGSFTSSDPCFDVATVLMSLSEREMGANAASLLETYHNTLESCGVNDYSADRFFDDFRVALVVRWLCCAIRSLRVPDSGSSERGTTEQPWAHAQQQGLSLMDAFDCADLFCELAMEHSGKK